MKTLTLSAANGTYLDTDVTVEGTNTSLTHKVYVAFTQITSGKIAIQYKPQNKPWSPLGNVDLATTEVAEFEFSGDVDEYRFVISNASGTGTIQITDSETEQDIHPLSFYGETGGMTPEEIGLAIKNAETIDSDKSADTFADLRLFTGLINGEKIYLKGHTTTGVGGGVFFVDTTNTDADDNGVTAVTGDGVRIVRVLNGYVTPEMFGAVGAGGDEVVELEAYLSYCLAQNVDYYPSAHSSGTQDVSHSGQEFNLGGLSYGISRTLFFGAFRYCKFTNGTIYPLDEFTDPYLCSGDGDFQSDITLDINFMCRHLTDSYYCGDHIRTTITGSMWGFITHNVYHPANQRELIIDSPLIAQYLFGETGYDNPDNITAFAGNFQGTDCVVTDRTVVINTIGFNVPFGGHYIGGHIYGPNQKSAVVLGSGAADNRIAAYIDNSYIEINGSFKGNDLSGSQFLYSKTDANFTPIRYKPNGASVAVSGLNITGATFTSAAVSINMIGVYIDLTTTGDAGTIAVGDTVTGGTSGATGAVISYIAGNVEVKMTSNAYFSAAETITATSGGTATVSSLSGSIGRLNNSCIIRGNTFPLKSGFKVNEFSTDFTVKRAVSAVTSEVFDLSSKLTQMAGCGIFDAKMSINSSNPVASSLTVIVPGSKVSSLTANLASSFTGTIIIDASLRQNAYETV